MEFDGVSLAYYLFKLRVAAMDFVLFAVIILGVALCSLYLFGALRTLKVRRMGPRSSN
jgi:hypothetical protein